MDNIQTEKGNRQKRHRSERGEPCHSRGACMTQQEDNIMLNDPVRTGGNAAEEMERTLPAGKLEQCPSIVEHVQYITQVGAINQAMNVVSKKPLTFADDMLDVLKRHCVMSEDEYVASALWVIASYQINSFRIFPKLSLISPEKRCGKTTTLEVITALSNDPQLVSNVSTAVLYRITATGQPTLLIDEVDMLIRNGETEIIGIINSSHNQSAAKVFRCVGDNHVPTPFSTWMPMVLASIGILPHTIMDRSIVINLRRKAANEWVQSPSVRIIDDCSKIRDDCQQWCLAASAQLNNAPLTPTFIGNDRAQDNWTPLFTIANELGGAWPSRCEQAYRCLTLPSEPELPTQLLNAIRAIFVTESLDQLGSSQIVATLLQDSDGPWLAMPTGGSLTAAKIANLLKPYGITPQCMRTGKTTFRGYKLAQFTDAFERYLPPLPD